MLKVRLVYDVRMKLPAFIESEGFRKILRWTIRICLVLIVLGLVAFLIVFRTAIYHRFVTFPRQARAWEALQMARQEVPKLHSWKEYKGNCHSHSHFSHDSEVRFEEILRVMHETDRDFIMMSDHWVNGKADYSLQWKGVKEGVLFIRGFEMDNGFIPWGMPDDTVIDKSMPMEAQAQLIEEKGGILAICHAEVPGRPWHLPQIDAMEIYNIHPDFEDENLADLAPDLLLNLRRWPDQTFRLIFDPSTEVIANWDRLNEDRDISGFAGNDCHQNVGVYGVWTDKNTLLLKNGEGETEKEYRAGFLSRLILRMFCGPLEAGREVFRIQLDPYERMTRFVSNHILAENLSEEALLDGLKEGRGFIGFDMIADSTGFTWLAEDGGNRAVMGETLPFSDTVRLRALSPCPCRFTIFNDGEALYSVEGRELEWQPSWRGKYRVEADLNIAGEWIPWVYTNPVELN